MRFPSLETLSGCAVLGAVALAVVGRTAQHAGYAPLLAFNICMLLGIFRYGFGTWSFQRHDPVGNVVGLVMMFTAASVLVIWIAWTNDSEKPLFLGPSWGLAVGFAAGLVISPGFAQETLRRRIGPGAGLPLLIQVLYTGDAELQRQATAGVATFELPAAVEAVPPLLVMADGQVQQQLHAHAALASLGTPLDDTDAVFERELKAPHFRAATSPLTKYPRATVAFLRDQLHTKSAFLQRRACEALGAMGPAAEGARADLMGLLHERDRSVSPAAARALAALGGPGIARLLWRQWPRLLFVAIVVLGIYGCSYTSLGRLNGYCLARDFGGENADPLLVNALGDSWSEVHWMAEKALVKRGRAAEPALRAGLQHKNHDVRERCAHLLEDLAKTP